MVSDTIYFAECFKGFKMSSLHLGIVDMSKIILLQKIVQKKKKTTKKK